MGHVQYLERKGICHGWLNLPRDTGHRRSLPVGGGSLCLDRERGRMVERSSQRYLLSISFLTLLGRKNVALHRDAKIFDFAVIGVSGEAFGCRYCRPWQRSLPRLGHEEALRRSVGYIWCIEG